MATWMAALQHGATEADLDALYKAVKDIIDRLHGRAALYEWTKLQLVQACLRHQTPIDYASFVRGVRDTIRLCPATACLRANGCSRPIAVASTDTNGRWMGCTQRVAKGLINLGLPESKHTAEFLAACDVGEPHPPAAYFTKLGMVRVTTIPRARSIASCLAACLLRHAC
jgi:hypothetical protein